MYTEVIYFKMIHKINKLELMRVTEKIEKHFNSINNNININEYLWNNHSV